MIISAERIVEMIREREPDITIQETDVAYIMPTICHNSNWRGAKMKLYLYKNPDSIPLFKCFTDCGESFNIFSFFQKYYWAKGKKVSLAEIKKEIFKTEGIPGDIKKQNFLGEELNTRKEYVDPLSIKLNTYPTNVLNLYPKARDTDPWALEGIDVSILNKYRITYSESFQRVYIPHFDWRGEFVGLKQRSYNEEEQARLGKFHPAYINGTLYRHMSAFNLFGIDQNAENIQNTGTVVLVEAEKGVLQAEQILGSRNIFLAVSGSNISSWQIGMLISYLQVGTVVIAFDKEYSTPWERQEYIKKLQGQVKYLKKFVNCYAMIDSKDRFNLKESPVDRTLKDYHSLDMALL